MRLGLNLGLCHIIRGSGASFSVSIGSGPFTTGTLLTATVNGLQGGETVTYQWTDDGANITGATSQTYTAAIGTDGIADASAIRCVVTVDGGDPITSASREIRYAAGTAPAVADGQSWTVDDTSVNIDGSASGANLTFSYALSGVPGTISINPSTGAITGTPTVAASGTATITAADQYGRTYQDTFTWSAALRTQATAADGLGPFNWTVDDTTVNVDATTDFTTNGNTLTYTATGLPAGVTIASNGIISGTPTAASSGSIVITGQDEYGRETTSATSHTTALRTQATGGADLDLAYPEDSAITPQNLLANWTANGNTLAFVSVSPSLPTGLSINSSGTLSGTPTTQTADATYTLTMQDEYGRQTADTFTLEITAVDSTAPTVSSITAGTQEADGDVPFTITDLSENATAFWVLTTSDQSAAANTAVKAAAQGGTALTDQADFGSFSATVGGGPYNEALTTGLTGNHYLQIVFEDAAGNLSIVYSDGPTVIDTTAPGVTSFSPADNATDVAVDATISIVFNESMKTTGTAASVTLKNVGGATIETFDPDVDGTWSTTTNTNDTWTVTPTSSFTNEASLAVQYSGFEDDTGNVIAAVSDDTTWNFDVVAAASGGVAPSIANINGGADTTATDPASGTDATFTETWDIDSGTDELLILSYARQGGTLTTMTVEANNASNSGVTSTELAVVDAGVDVSCAAHHIAITAGQTTVDLTFTTSFPTWGLANVTHVVYEGKDWTVGTASTADSAADPQQVSLTPGAGESVVAVCALDNGTLDAGVNLTVDVNEAQDSTNVMLVGVNTNAAGGAANYGFNFTGPPTNAALIAVPITVN